MQKKYKIIIISASIALVIAVSAFFAGVYFPRQSTSAPTKSAANGDYTYLIKYENNEIAVYDCQNNKRLYNLSVDIDILPETDREALRQGIYIKDKQSLRQTIEDLTG